MKKLLFILITLIFILITLIYVKKDSILVKPVYIKNTNVKTDYVHAYAKTKIPEKKNDTDYLLTLEIPKINIKNKVYKIGSTKNNVDSNVTILKESSMPDKDNGSIFLAAHRGNTKVSYFENLHKLERGDKIYIDYNDKRYEYIIKYSFITDKDGTISLNLNKNKKSIALITCVKDKFDKQIVFIGYST